MVDTLNGWGFACSLCYLSNPVIRGFVLPLDNSKFSYDISVSENNKVKVSGMYFNGWHYLIFDLKGEYVINPDSLKLGFSDKNIRGRKIISLFCN